MKWEFAKVNWHFAKKISIFFGQNVDFEAKSKLIVDKYV